MQKLVGNERRNRFDGWYTIQFSSCFLLSALFCVSPSLQNSTRAAEIAVEKSEHGATVKIDGQLFTEYRTRSGTKPILWPVVGPTGQAVTRSYPVDAVLGPSENKDHIHHRSLWFTHGDVDGISFWHETGTHGTIQHRRFDTVQSGAPGVIVTSNDWIGPHGRKILEDQRTLRFDTDGDSRWIDFDVTMTANDKPVRFGDTKEGSLGIRVAGTMKVEAQPGGQIVNSEGHKDEQAWGKAAAWVDYHGPVDGKTVGIAILNHPNSFRHPTYWHVRTYGLLAANPFGLNDFTSGAKQGSYTLPAGESITLRYRILLHQGDQVEGKVAEAYAAYAATKPDGNVKPSSDE